MKKFLLLTFVLLNLLACEPIFSSSKYESTETYQPNSIVNPNFFIAVKPTDSERITAITLAAYEQDQKSKEPYFTLFLPTRETYIQQCGRVKFSCSASPLKNNTYIVGYSGLFGEGTASTYCIENNKIIPLSFSCTPGFCKADDS